MDDLTEVHADDVLINGLATGASGTDELTELLAAWIAATAGVSHVERLWDVTAVEQKTMTRDELLAEARRRFGDDVTDMAFVCPRCGDIATVAEFQKLGAGWRAGSECIGRMLGALQGSRAPGRDGVIRGVAIRGCVWTAYGLFPGPWTIMRSTRRTGAQFRARAGHPHPEPGARCMTTTFATTVRQLQTIVDERPTHVYRPAAVDRMCRYADDLPGVGLVPGCLLGHWLHRFHKIDLNYLAGCTGYNIERVLPDMIYDGRIDEADDRIRLVRFLGILQEMQDSEVPWRRALQQALLLIAQKMPVREAVPA